MELCPSRYIGDLRAIRERAQGGDRFWLKLPAAGHCGCDGDQPVFRKWGESTYFRQLAPPLQGTKTGCHW